MPTRNPRINVVLKKPLFDVVKILAEESGLSLSSQVEELLRGSLETMEDVGLAKLAERRLHSFDRKKALSHNRFWKKALKSSRS